MEEPLESLVAICPNSASGLVWLVNSGNRKAGDVACGSINSTGRYMGRINNRVYKAHRVVFYLHYGYWPVMVDHIDGNPLNNHPSNLRETNNTENQHNQRKALGYSKVGSRYKAVISAYGKNRYIGTYATPQEARAAYLAAKAALHPTTPEDYFT